ncbi:phosphoenolpyruvate synthase family protein [Arthrobacter globiformis NBRC 12137]|uniref:Phosphoenolpyruvate synthase family protein n=1 Tax=Arthrobacter globiformis (strain ATCC 8010 / DSM 20124 / JCM 1332 / NBRC 12137 / NCIMB 8907 / NRRL B-2979 / 168) TaxID=1077972 RepID=H0QQG2_ARTG1|nr:PEP/pyruvate-binding domain-containing protein [Arthrobacter globiformis]GAB15063.1 phosphoenolpyruvate synthase family protein [Arthrobacter globiformis NBRC 12137]
MEGHADRPASRPGNTVISLAHVDADMVPEVGGKAANLGVLLAAGLPVPSGFCVTTAAYRRVAAAAGVEPSEPAEQTRSRLASAALPADIVEAILAAYAGLGEDTPVAVRSSATAEDLPEASFAGQLDSYLNVVGADALLDAVRRCWASLWTDRAVAYRADHGIAQRSVGIAVVVQEMVDAGVAGVMFTANPLTGRRQETVIDAARGLGEALVSGAVNPDHFTVDAATGEILQRSLGDKLIESRPAPGGGTRVLRRQDGGAQPCLTDEQVRSLASLGTRVEVLYGEPQDLEWAIEPRGGIRVVQSRPITTLFPLPEPHSHDDGVRAYLCASLLQGLTRPLTPMGLASFTLMSDRARPTAAGDGPGAYRSAQVGMRMFVDVTPMLRSKGGRCSLQRAMKVADARSVDVLAYLAADPRFSLTKASGAALKAGLRGTPPFGLLGHVLAAMANPAAALDRVRESDHELDRILMLPEPASGVLRLDFVERLLSKDITPAVMRVLPPAAAGYIWLGLARLLLGRLVRAGELQAVLRGLPHNVTTEMDLELWRTAASIREDPESVRALTGEDPRMLAGRYTEGSLPAVCQGALRGFLATYGHRAVAEIDLGVPRWGEDPAHIINVLANYLRLADPELAPDRRFRRAAEQAEAKVAELAERSARSRGRPFGRIVAHSLRRARETAGMREYPKFRLITAFAVLRRQLQLVGEELAEAGRIAVPEDVFFLDLAEARVALRGADLRGPVAERRRRYDREMRRRRVPRLLLSDGTDVEAAMGAQARAVSSADGQLPPGTLAGTAASAGSVTGKARVILDPAGAHLEPGEILVAPSTDPGWTPLFMTAGALVMEMGGPISHGAVVAREYGIPAVVGVPDATTRIQTGDTVTVDGAAGTIVVDAERQENP